jgi:hypothetical protein
MPGIEARSRGRTVEIKARLAIAPELAENDGNGCFVRREVVPNSSRIKIMHYVTDSNPIPITALAFDLPDTVR